jgi:hypothetical protein
MPAVEVLSGAVSTDSNCSSGTSASCCQREDRSFRPSPGGGLPDHRVALAVIALASRPAAPPALEADQPLVDRLARWGSPARLPAPPGGLSGSPWRGGKGTLRPHLSGPSSPAITAAYGLNDRGQITGTYVRARAAPVRQVAPACAAPLPGSRRGSNVDSHLSLNIAGPAQVPAASVTAGSQGPYRSTRPCIQTERSFRVTSDRGRSPLAYGSVSAPTHSLRRGAGSPRAHQQMSVADCRAGQGGRLGERRCGLVEYLAQRPLFHGPSHYDCTTALDKGGMPCWQSGRGLLTRRRPT